MREVAASSLHTPVLEHVTNILKVLLSAMADSMWLRMVASGSASGELRS